MVLTRAVMLAAAAGLFALHGMAQAGPYGGLQTASAGSPGFAPLSAGDSEQKRTAELLADLQQRSSPSYRASARGATRFNDRMLVTRREQQEAPLYARAETIPPPSTSYRGNNAAYVNSASPALTTSPTDAAYANSYGLSANTIPQMPDARPGECFALSKTPEKFSTRQQEYELRAASERIETTPPRYELVNEQYVVREAYERMEVIPAAFRTVTEQVEVAPPSTRYITSEPIYETVTERVLEQPARTVWKRGNGPIQRIDNATGDILCLVEEPAVYKTIQRRVLRQAADVREVPVPGQTALVSKQVIDRPAEVRRVVVPEQLGTRTVRRLADPGSARRIQIPAQTGTTTVRELVEPSRLEWRPVLCETNMTPDVIRRVQQALMDNGFNPGPATGRLNRETIDALNAYQRAKNLPEDRYLNMETVRALGVM